MRNVLNRSTMSDPTPKLRRLDSNYFQHSVPSISLDYYDPDSHGKDDFSRKQVWFYVYGDEELEEEFKKRMTNIFEEIIMEGDVDWDVLALYPTHSEGGLNSNMRDLFMDIASESGIRFNQVLERTESVEQNHELTDEKAKVVNLEGSLKVKEDLEGKNILLVDNIVSSGVSMLHGANKLKEHRADKVLAVSLGTDKKKKEQTREIGDEFKTSEIFSKGEG